MMTLHTNHLRDTAHYAQAELRNINENPIGKRYDADSRSAMLSIMAKSIIHADKAMCHRGMAASASLAL